MFAACNGRMLVQAHLSNVYNKLGLRSRVQLAQETTRHA